VKVLSCPAAQEAERAKERQGARTDIVALMPEGLGLVTMAVFLTVLILTLM